MCVEDGMVKVAPHQLVDPRTDALLRLRLGGGQREGRPHTLAHGERTEAQVRGEPGGAGNRWEVAIDVIATRRTVEERFEPLSRRRGPATRDVGRIRTELRLAKERHGIDRRLGDARRKRGRRKGAGRACLVPPPPRTSIGTINGVGATLHGAYLVAFEDETVLAGSHPHTVAFQGGTNLPIPALRIRAVVPVPGHQRRLAGPCKSRQATIGGAPHDDEPGSGGLQRRGEVLDALAQKPETRMRLAMPIEQRIVEHEHRCQCLGLPAGCGECGIVGEAQVASEPVDGSHGGMLGSPGDPNLRGSGRPQ